MGRALIACWVAAFFFFAFCAVPSIFCRVRVRAVVYCSPDLLSVSWLPLSGVLLLLSGTARDAKKKQDACAPEGR